MPCHADEVRLHPEPERVGNKQGIRVLAQGYDGGDHYDENTYAGSTLMIRKASVLPQDARMAASERGGDP